MTRRYCPNAWPGKTLHAISGATSDYVWWADGPLRTPPLAGLGLVAVALLGRIR